MITDDILMNILKGRQNQCSCHMGQSFNIYFFPLFFEVGERGGGGGGGRPLDGILN